MLSVPAWPDAAWRDHSLKYVSLLPLEIKQKRIRESRQGKIVRIMFLVFVGLLGIYAFLLVSTFMTRSNLQSLQAERQSVEDQAEALQEFEDLYNRMSDAEGKVNTAMGRVPEWGVFLSDLGTVLDPDISLTDIQVSSGEDAGSFNMNGWTYAHGNVADMLERVYTLEQLEDVRIQMSSETTVGDRDAVQFTVDAVLLPGPQFFDPGEEDN